MLSMAHTHTFYFSTIIIFLADAAAAQAEDLAQTKEQRDDDCRRRQPLRGAGNT
jgi:hypothetical protein